MLKRLLIVKFTVNHTKDSANFLEVSGLETGMTSNLCQNDLARLWLQMTSNTDSSWFIQRRLNRETFPGLNVQMPKMKVDEDNIHFAIAGRIQVFGYFLILSQFSFLFRLDLFPSMDARHKGFLT